MEALVHRTRTRSLSVDRPDVVEALVAGTGTLNTSFESTNVVETRTQNLPVESPDVAEALVAGTGTLNAPFESPDGVGALVAGTRT